MKIGKLLYLDVTVHDAHTMTVVKGPQELIQVATDIIISQGLGQCNSKLLLNTWIILDNTWYSCLKSVLLTCSNISAGVRLTGSYGYQFLTASTFDKKLGHYLDNSMERDHISSSSQIFQNFYLSLDFLFLDWLQCFHHALFIVVYVDGLEHLHRKRKNGA